MLTCVAGASSPPSWAGASEGVSMVIAGASIAAGAGIALALTRVARLAFPAIGALTVKAIDQVLTEPAILTRVPAALIHI